jgi:hypothetical protein
MCRKFQLTSASTVAIVAKAMWRMSATVRDVLGRHNPSSFIGSHETEDVCRDREDRLGQDKHLLVKPRTDVST